MRRALIAGFCAVALAGCAKFPDNAAAGFTRILVRIQFAGEVNTNDFIYDVAVHASTELSPQDQFAPRPVIGENNPNGRMAGSPTHFVEFTGANGSINPFVIFRFPTQAEAPNPDEPNNPVNITTPFRSTRRQIVNFRNPFSGPSNVLEFEIFTDQLVQTDAQAQQLQTLLLNVFTMNRLSNTGGGNRMIDMLGDGRSSTLNDFLRIDLRANRIYEDPVDDSGSLPDFEPANDTLPLNLTSDPALDIVAYRIEVQRP